MYNCCDGAWGDSIDRYVLRDYCGARIKFLICFVSNSGGHGAFKVGERRRLGRSIARSLERNDRLVRQSGRATEGSRDRASERLGGSVKDMTILSYHGSFFILKWVGLAALNPCCLHVAAEGTWTTVCEENDVQSHKHAKQVSCLMLRHSPYSKRIYTDGGRWPRPQRGSRSPRLPPFLWFHLHWLWTRLMS